jgi:hypothetical protein
VGPAYLQSKGAVHALGRVGLGVGLESGCLTGGLVCLHLRPSYREEHPAWLDPLVSRLGARLAHLGDHVLLEGDAELAWVGVGVGVG